MLDFTSSLYLGLRHGSSDLPAWRNMTLGKPAALEDPPGATIVERELGRLTGCQAAMLATSTLHAFFDLFAMLAEPGAGVFLDAASYPIAAWAARQAAIVGCPAQSFRRQDPAHLQHLLARTPCARPIIVTDGICLATGRPAPLSAYLRLAVQAGGLVVVDDTQPLGILGVSPGGFAPYGIGGGGSLRHAGIEADAVIVVSSLAKAFGAPVAMLGGATALITRLRGNSLVRKHCSPPSAANILSAAHALRQNQCRGDELRGRLACNVARLRHGLTRLGIATDGTLFPVQPLCLPPRIRAATMHMRLQQRGVEAVLHSNPAAHTQVSFLVTARHAPAEIDAAIEILEDALKHRSRRQPTGAHSHDIPSEFRG
jgi:8-amino-7-oxononanoate synthase